LYKFGGSLKGTPLSADEDLTTGCENKRQYIVRLSKRVAVFFIAFFLYKNTKKPNETGTYFFICIGLLPKTSGLRRNRRTNRSVGSPAQQSFLRINRNK
jgi:hypothetical protein